MSAKNRSPIDVLIHCPGSHGAIADQVHKQANTLHELGIRVLVLCSPNFLRTRATDYPTLACMTEGATQEGGLASRKVAKAKQTIRNQWIFAWQVYVHKPKIVLTGSHTDMHSPLWIWPHVILSRFARIVYATNLHFSARDHSLGPKWWGILSARLSFTPFRIAIAHKRLSNSTQLPRHIHPVEVPLGPDFKQSTNEKPKDIRARWRVPRGKKVLLAFGTIRNHKNVDLAIRALIDNPDIYLVVIGSVSSHKDKPLKYYQMLADDLGLSKRVLISDEFVGDERRLSYFRAADFILLTYAGSFHSQTATLTTAVNARRRVLASSGASPMEDLVAKFGLGVYVEPDSSDAVADGMATLVHGKLPEPDWEGYEAHATWETNVTRLLEATVDYLNGRSPREKQFEPNDYCNLEIPELLNARRLHHQKPQATKKSAPRARKISPRKKTAAAATASTPAFAEADPPAKANGHSLDQPVFPGFDHLEPMKTAADKPVPKTPPVTAGKRTPANAETVKTAPRRKTKPAGQKVLASH